ncbi:putative methyl-CpG-binding domain protein 5-like [Apostichopus japonicus]|uniref:Putative methyl-CpG-binding domain protein 5-like n=1 Tax=Stichopus japonicus TaxID=307972 RepID=A0A2G8KXS3_STIJA|nr:putative methyl-CpG-binding domain protein 5-like [Apostichopus japonicus]
MACPGKGSEQAGVTNQVTVPFGWERIVKDGLVSYISPSGVQLSSTDEVKAYLIADNTCKCGLECPVHIEKIFIFDGRVSSSSNPGGESSPASSCKHAVRRNDGGEQRKPIHNQGLPIVSSNLRSSVLHPGGVLPVQMRPSLQRSDLLMQNSIEAQQHQIQLKIREQVFVKPKFFHPTVGLLLLLLLREAHRTPVVVTAMLDSSSQRCHSLGLLPMAVKIKSISKLLCLVQSWDKHADLHDATPRVGAKATQQQANSMHHHPGRLESNPPPNKRQRSKSLEEQQWYYSMMRNSAPLSPVGANIVPGVSTFYQPGLPLMNVYGQPSNLVSFQPSFPVAEYPMIFSRGGGNMSMMRHVTPVSSDQPIFRSPLGIPCYGSTVQWLGAGAVPFGMVPQPVHQRAFVRLPPVDPVSSSCNTPPNGLFSSSVPTSVVTSSPHIVLQAPKTVKDMLAENRSSQGRSDASGAESSQTRTSLGMEQEAVRNEVAETLCSLSSAGEVLFETNGSDIPSETKERSEQLVNNQRDCTTTADGRLDHEQKACGTTTHKGDVTITPGLSELEQASGVCGGLNTGGKVDGVKGDHKERGTVPSSCSPQALSTFLPTVSSYEKADSTDHRTSGETTTDHENDSLVQSETALSNVELVREDEQSSSVSNKLSRVDCVEVDDDSVKETKIAAVETLLQLSSHETLYSVREGEANEQELTGASSIVSSVQSADVINDVINMHQPLKQLCNKTVWDNSCPSSAVGLLSDCNNSSLPSLRNESRDQMQLSDSVCESSASRCRDVTFVAKSGNENFELCVESETKHEDALVNSDLPNQRITTQNNSYSDTGLEERLVSHGLDESETKESQENIGDPCTDTREVRKNDGGVHLQENISTSEMDTEKGITLEAGCENVMCNDTNVCENNSSMVDAVKGRAQTLDESKQSLPGSYLTEVSDEDQIVNEREEISCPKDENIVEVGNKLNYLGVTVEKTDKVEVTDLKCDKVKGSKQCQDSNEMDIGQEVGRDETEASKSVILTHPVVTAKSDDKVESIILLQDDNNKMEIQEVVKDKAEASKSFKLTHREETTPTGEKNLLPQNRNVSNEMNPESSDKENVEDCDSSCVSRTMSPEPSEDTSQEDEKGCASKDEKLSSSDLTGDKISLSPNDSVLIDSTLININTEQEKHSLKEVESSNLLSSLDLAGSKSQTSIVNYTEDSVNAAQVDPNIMAENGDVYLSGVPIGRGAEKDVLMNGSSLSCLNCSVKETTLSRSRLIKDQEQAFTNVGRITRRRRLDPVLAVETNGGSISSTEIPSRALRRHFETGDLVWGQLRGHTSWPGKLVSDGDVKGQTRKEHGKVWVMWFGDHSFAQVEPDKLKTLSEGLEAHHNARTRVSRARRVTTNLEAAIQEAMLELDKQSEQVKVWKTY